MEIKQEIEDDPQLERHQVFLCEIKPESPPHDNKEREFLHSEINLKSETEPPSDANEGEDPLLQIAKCRAIKPKNKKQKTAPERSSCPLCPKSFKLSKHLNRHLKFHIGGRALLSCDSCPRKFSCQSALDTHIASHSKEKNFRCGQCDKAFKHVYHLTEHEKTHSEEYVRPQCEFCSRQFNRNNEWRRHLSRCSQREEVVCHICLRKLRTESKLNSHLRVHRERDGSGGFPCWVCSWVFESRSALRVHETSHFDMKPYRCQNCAASFKYKGSLAKHLKIYCKTTKEIP